MRPAMNVEGRSDMRRVRFVGLSFCIIGMMCCSVISCVTQNKAIPSDKHNDSKVFKIFKNGFGFTGCYLIFDSLFAFGHQDCPQSLFVAHSRYNERPSCLQLYTNYQTTWLIKSSLFFPNSYKYLPVQKLEGEKNLTGQKLKLRHDYCRLFLFITLILFKENYGLR